ncbi:MAG: hypothetical protein IAF94_10615 [Pirellulaceae bacterium]|nr:hypothetical protein [Pirellulaceae bacterium]
MLQFSLRNLLIAVAAVAVGTAALLNAGAWWVSLLWGAVLLLLALAGFAAYFRREAQRAFWSGYLVAGSLYLLLLMYSVPQISQTNTWMPFGPLNYSSLVTTKVIYWAYSLLPTSKTTPQLTPPTPPAGMGMSSASMSGGMGGGQFSGGGQFVGGGMGFGGPPNPDYIDQELFAQVGQALWMLFVSWLGGTVAWGLFRTRGKSDNAANTAP